MQIDQHDAPLFDLLITIALEVKTAEAKHQPFNSHHEAFAVILEELDEYWDEVRLKAENRNPEHLQKELIQTAAMCVRALRDLCDG